MNLWEILKTSKGLPPPDLETLLFAQKISGQAVGGSTLKTLTASGYPCVLEGSVGMLALNYKIYGNSVQDGTPSPENPIEVQSVGKLVTEGEFSGKYVIPVVVSGKNLFDYTNIIDEYRIVWATGVLYKDPNAQISEYIPINSHKEYVTSSKVNIAGYDLNKNYLGVYNGHEFVKTTVTSLYNRFITTDDCRFIRIFKYGTVKNFENDFQLELGTESTPYEPYHEPVTTNIYLDKPLRKIGDYADVIDFERGVVERNTIEYVLTGDEPFRYASSDKNRAVGSLIFSNIRDISVFFSNMFHAPPYENTEYNRMVLTKGWLYVSLSYELIGGSYYDSDDTKIANIVNWLKERYESGNPLTVVATYKSTTEPISTPSIPTFDGTTVISADTEIQPSNMEIKYKARK